MKRNDILIAAGLIVYAILFYHQQAGINFLLFNLFLIGALLTKDKLLIRQPSWIAVAMASLASSLCLFIYGNVLSITANFISIGILAAMSINSGSSIIFAALHSVYSFISAIPYIINRHLHKEDKQDAAVDNTTGIKIVIVALPFLVALIFFFLYRSANPIFKSYTDLINFDFISFEWLRFMLVGWLLIYAYFNQVQVAYLFEKDQEGSDLLKAHRFETSLALPKINYENLSGIVLFSLLNVLILFLNIIDFHSILFSGFLPEDISHSELVHQGVGLLIVSIIIAISIILFYFRGALNFFRTNNTIKVLAYLWIVQNIVLVITTTVKNHWYVEEFSLTYKRIGVYVYLLLTLVGLVTTFIKIYSTRSNWFLFRKNGWIFYSILIISCFFNWDLIITNYNLKHSKTLDREYLLRISYTAIPELLQEKNFPATSNYANLIHRYLYNFLSEEENTEWQSYNLEDARIKNQLKQLSVNGKLMEIDLTGKNISSISCLSLLPNLESLILKRTGFKECSELEQMSHLKKLDLSANNMGNINSLPALPNLAYLDLSYNSLSDLNALQNTPNLVELNIKGTYVGDITPVLSLHKLKTLTCDSLSREQYLLLKQTFPTLQLKVDDASIFEADNAMVSLEPVKK